MQAGRYTGWQPHFTRLVDGGRAEKRSSAWRLSTPLHRVVAGAGLRLSLMTNPPAHCGSKWASRTTSATSARQPAHSPHRYFPTVHPQEVSHSSAWGRSSLARSIPGTTPMRALLIAGLLASAPAFADAEFRQGSDTVRVTALPRSDAAVIALIQGAGEDPLDWRAARGDVGGATYAACWKAVQQAGIAIVVYADGDMGQIPLQALKPVKSI